MLVVEEDKDILRMDLVVLVVEVVGEQQPLVMEHMQQVVVGVDILLMVQ
jgi:hypothetical protein